MYTSPNGMVFKSYADSMEYNRRMVHKEFEEFYKHSEFKKVFCKICHGECAKIESRKVYICMRCGVYMEGDDESEN